ncbi:MAG: hypothetical protein H7178_02665 [Chitinophagaceae bacterium]|nr:hypothetical protein [Chitinophagaceae bacterium]
MKKWHKIEAIIVWGLLILALLLFVLLENKIWTIIPALIFGIIEILYEGKKYKKDQ